MRHAEALLLVDDEQSEIVKMNVLLQQLVRADDQIDLAGLQIEERFFDLRRRTEAGKHIDGDREGRKAAHGRETVSYTHLEAAPRLRSGRLGAVYRRRRGT